MLKNLIINTVGKVLPDSLYLKLMYRYIMGERLNLKDPKTSNEKMQWIKLYDRKDIYTTMVDKYEMKSFIEKKIGPGFTLKTFSVWDSVDDIVIDDLPNQFVLKNTRGKGVVICKDKTTFDLENAKAELRELFDKNMFWYAREWPYKNVRPRVIAEEYLSNGDRLGLVDYKISCYEGEPAYIETIYGRFTKEGIEENYYDFNWNKMDLSIEAYESGSSDIKIPKPQRLKEMKRFSEKLSEGTHYLRVDWYVHNEKIYVGELTFFDEAGFVKWKPREQGLYWGEKIRLDRKY